MAQAPAAPCQQDSCWEDTSSNAITRFLVPVPSSRGSPACLGCNQMGAGVLDGHGRRQRVRADADEHKQAQLIDGASSNDDDGCIMLLQI